MKPVKLGRDARDIKDVATDELAHFGITHIRVGRKKRHPTIKWDVAGKHFEFSIPGTPSDHRSGKNVVTEIRQLCKASGLIRMARIPIVKKAQSPIKHLKLAPIIQDKSAAIPLPELAEQSEISTVIPPPVDSVVEPEQTKSETATETLIMHDFWRNAEIPLISGRPMVYVPRPVEQPVLVVRVGAGGLALIEGDVVVINLHENRMFHLTEDQLQAIYQPSNHQPKLLNEAVSATTRHRPDPHSQKPSADAKPDNLRRRFGVGAQLGRVLLTMRHIEINDRINKITSADIIEVLHEQDRKSLSTQLTAARNRGLVTKVGSVPGDSRALYYQLSDKGKELPPKLGIWPFTMAGQKPPV